MNCFSLRADGRAGSRPSFGGRHNRRQRFCVVSFPGCHQAEWERATEGQRKLAMACVFFREGHPNHGRHSVPCQCRRLYANRHPDCSAWRDGRAPCGCYWFDEWLCNLAQVLDSDQVGIVVYKRGKLEDVEDGLGFSQKAEVEAATDFPIPLVSVDIDEFTHVIMPLVRDQESFGSLPPEAVKRLLERRLGAHHRASKPGPGPARRLLERLGLRAVATALSRLLPCSA